MKKMGNMDVLSTRMFIDITNVPNSLQTNKKAGEEEEEEVEKEKEEGRRGEEEGGGGRQS